MNGSTVPHGAWGTKAKSKSCRLLPCIATFVLLVSLLTATNGFSKELKVRYGFHREFPPFSYEENGKPTGFEVELLQAALRENDIKLFLRPMNWDNALDELARGSISITSGVAKTQRREILFNFSNRPSARLYCRFYTLNSKRLPNIDAFRGRRVGVEENSYYQRLLERFGGVNIKLFGRKLEGLRALLNGYVEAYFGADKIIEWYAHQDKIKGISPVGRPLQVVQLYFAVNKDETEVYQRLNKGLDRIWDNGEYDKIFKKWFLPDLGKADIDTMVKSAKKSLANAYAPYSQEIFGAAVQGKTGRIYLGCSIENGLPALTVGALRVAVLRAVAEGEEEFISAVKVDMNGTAVPPNADERRVLQEFGRGIQVITEPKTGEYRVQMVSEFLPYPEEVRAVPLPGSAGQSGNARTQTMQAPRSYPGRPPEEDR